MRLALRAHSWQAQLISIFARLTLLIKLMNCSSYRLSACSAISAFEAYSWA